VGDQTTETSASPLRDAWARMRPPAPTPPITRLRVLIAVTAVAVLAVEVLNFIISDESGFGMAVRTVWALLRVIGILALMRAVRFGRAVSRPFGLILAVTTVFAVARLVAPRTGGLLPRVEVVAGLVVLTVLCSAILLLLYRSPAVAAHLAHRPARRHVPPSVLTARVAVLSLAPLVLVPLLVGVGVLVTDHREMARLLPLLGGWGVLFLALTVVVPLSSFFVLMGQAWARWLIGTATVLVLVLQPLLCYAVLGLDGLLRDGVPLIVTGLVALVALHRSRGVPTWVRPA
jgi:hypothetical protein